MILKERTMTDLENREAFKAWFKKEYLGIDDLANQGDEGAITRRDYAYVGWQAAKAQAVPEGYVLVKKVHPDAIVHNQGLGLFKECQVIYGWDGKSKDFKEALNKGFYHGVKLGAKAVLETAMIEAQEQGHE